MRRYFLLTVYQRAKLATAAALAAIRQPGSFVQNIAMSFSASAGVAVLGIALTPIISRIYPPASYGQFAVYSTVVGNLLMISLLTLPGAMLLPKTQRTFIELANALVLLTLLSVTLVSVVLVIYWRELVNYWHVPAIGSYLFLLPIAIFFTNLSSIIGSWNLRRKDFRLRAVTDMSSTLVGRGSTIGLGLLLHGASAGLMLGDTINRVAHFILLFFGGFYREVKQFKRMFSWRGSWQAIRTYSDFPLYVLPANYISALSTQIPIFLLTSNFGATVVGLYSFSVSLLELPLNLVGSAVSPVFMQKATETFHTDPARLKDITLSIYNKMLYLGLLPFGFLTVFGDIIFRIAFGAKWEGAGVFTAYLGYYYVFKLTGTVTAPIYTIIQKQRYALISSAMLLLFRVGALLIGIALHDVNKALLLFGVGSLLITFFTDLHILYLLKAPVLLTAVRTAVLTALAIGLMWGLRMGLHTVIPQWV